MSVGHLVGARACVCRALTWELAPFDGYAGCGETRGEQLCLCGLP